MLLDEVGTYLQAQSIGTLGTDLFLGKLPESPDACVAVYEYAGFGPHRAMGQAVGAPVAERPRMQVVARAATYAAARSKAHDAWKKLDGHNGTLSGVEYLWIEALQSPFLLTRDENDRVLIACNFEVTKRVSAS